MSLTVVTGLAAEARIAGARHMAMLVGAGQTDRLANDLEAAIANGARRLLSFGVAGGLSPRLQAGDLIIAQGVWQGAQRFSCDPSWRGAMSGRLQSGSASVRPAEPVGQAAEDGEERSPSAGLFRFSRDGGWRRIEDLDGPCAIADIVGVDAPVADAASKSALFAATGAAAVDMESGIVARAAQRHGLPFAILRVIADSARRPLPSAALVAMRADGEVDTTAVLGALARDPAQLPALLRLAFDSREAFAALVRARAVLGADFASAALEELSFGADDPGHRFRRHLDRHLDLHLGAMSGGEDARPEHAHASTVHEAPGERRSGFRPHPWRDAGEVWNDAVGGDNRSRNHRWRPARC